MKENEIEKERDSTVVRVTYSRFAASLSRAQTKENVPTYMLFLISAQTPIRFPYISISMDPSLL